MTINFDENDKIEVRKQLEDAGITITPQRIEDVLYNVRAAFMQQFDEEADYMINEFEADQ